MSFPVQPLDVRTELQIGGVWTDISADVYTRSPITIDHGRKDEGTRTDPSKCALELNNKLGKYSPRNPMSPYYGLIGRNTPIRVSVPGDESYLLLDGTAAGFASTPDAAALDITADIDLRAEASLDWTAPGTQTLIGKWGGAGARSYLLMIESGILAFRWSTDGTNGFFVSLTLPHMPRRGAVRATIDVDNGAGGRTTRLYWAESLDGPWTQIGSDVVTTGTTSIFNSASGLAVAPSDVSSGRLPAVGRIHRAEVRSGIDGTIVANPDFRTLAAGASGFTDSAGRAWTVTAPATVTNRAFRFTGEVSSWPSRWDVSGKDVWTSIEAAGIQRRMGQGKKPLASTLRRRIPSGSPLAYWPMEDGENATQAYSTVPRVLPLTTSGFDYAAEDGLGGSSPLPKLGATASFRGPIPRRTASGWHVEMVYRLPTMPAAQTEILRVTVTGSVARTVVVYASTAGVRLEALDITGDVIVSVIYSDPGAIGQFTARWNRLQVFTSDEGGGTTRITARWRDINGAGGMSWVTTTFTGAMGAATAVSGTYGAATEGMVLGHLAAFDVPGTGTTAGVTIYDQADDGYTGESAIDRLARLTREENIGFDWIDGDTTRASEAMGPQRPETLLELLQTCADTDGGVLYEDRERLGLLYRDRTSLYNQTPRLALNYETDGEVGPPLEPVEDDQKVRNDVTITREGGSSARAVDETSPLSIQAPPDGIGLYDESVTLSLATDGQAEQIAAWRLHHGTWDEARYPSVRLMLHAAPHLIPDLLALQIGDKATITNPPAWLPPDDIELLVQGYTEVLDQYTWDVVLNCSPARPWTVGVLEDEVLGRLDTDGAVIGAAVDATATTLEVHTDTAVGPRWIDSAGYPAMFPFAVQFGGERATVTAIVNRADTFTRTVASGWGTSSSGQAWTELGGLTSDRSVDGTRGVITLPANVDTIRRQILTPAVADAEVLVSISPGQVSTGNSLIPGVLLRHVDGSNFYRVRLHFRIDSAVYLVVTRGGTEQGAQVVTGLTYAANDVFWLRAKVIGDRVLGRVWKDGTPEPHDWGIDRTITTSPIASGGVGVSGSALGGLTNVNPVTRYDNFEVITPQRFTVARSVNGVSKSHGAGTALSLHDPIRLAL
ncbi:hypothetical protein [Streptomyces sp. CB03234]|uniref:hypothetical protein n=1 Tax=Streptomyces sp. (strain CB03234) TaxID=1703937 RepID=UPI00093A8896|nr:hypothetical protein [Streptomyces sp. CB03234]